MTMAADTMRGMSPWVATSVSKRYSKIIPTLDNEDIVMIANNPH